MFEHVTLLLSFVYVMALTHLLSSSTELVTARNRTRFSGLYVLGVFNALLMLLVNWLALWGLSAIKHWTVLEVVIQFASAIVQYFTCSTFRINEHSDGEIDLPALFNERRPVIFSAYTVLGLIAIFQNWWDRNNLVGLRPNDWIGEDVAIVPLLIAVAIQGWVGRIWFLWGAGLLQLGLSIFFMFTYAMPGA